MSNMYGAHIFKVANFGDREEVKIKLFNTNGTPLELGEPPEPPDLSAALLAAWKGDFVNTLDYHAGSLVRKDGHTYLALLDAPHTALEPGEEIELVSAVIPHASDGYALPRDVVATLAGLTGGGGYNMSGSSFWFKLSGTPTEELTISAQGSDLANVFHFYGPGGENDWVSGSNFNSPKTVVVPTEGFFYVEVKNTVTSVKYVGPSGPQPLPDNPWVEFA